jgi:hypothetical protein
MIVSRLCPVVNNTDSIGHRAATADSNARRPGIPISSRPPFRPDRGHRSDFIAATIPI